MKSRFIIQIAPIERGCVGYIHPFAADTLPKGYAWCDGGYYSSVVYPELEKVMGYRYGGMPAYGLIKMPDLTEHMP